MKSENFLFRVQKNYSDTDAAAAAGAAAASAVCTVHVVIEGGFAPLYKYMVKYTALLVVDVVKLTVSLTGQIVMLTTPWHLA